MAKRIRRGTKQNPMPDDWKAKIRASALLNRLNDCAMGAVEMTPAQIKAAEIILRKTVPDMARIENQQLDKHGNPADNKVTVEIVKKTLTDT